jgi:hypothetical protein
MGQGAGLGTEDAQRGDIQRRRSAVGESLWGEGWA